MAGRIRPAWQPAWSRLSCAVARTGSFIELEVAVRFEGADELPGAVVTATYAGPQSSAPEPWRYDTEAFTGNDGVAILKLQPGPWHIHAQFAGMYSVERDVMLRTDERCRIDGFTEMREWVIIT